MVLSARAWARKGRLQLAVLVILGLAPVPASSYPERSAGTPEQIAWVRRAAGNFVSAELAGNGAGACAILAAPLRADRHGRTCAQRWDAKLARMLQERGERQRLRKLLDATSSATVVVRGNGASIDLPEPLIDSANRFVWTENCWMLRR